MRFSHPNEVLCSSPCGTSRRKIQTRSRASLRLEAKSTVLRHEKKMHQLGGLVSGFRTTFDMSLTAKKTCRCFATILSKSHWSSLSPHGQSFEKGITTLSQFFIFSYLVLFLSKYGILCFYPSMRLHKNILFFKPHKLLWMMN